jgi:lipoyl-dependent peroxiredoxin subunit D
MTLDELRAALPETAKDIRVNLQNVLGPGKLEPQQRWGVAIACALAARHHELAQALVQAAGGEISPEVLDDARAAAALMAMTNVYYRFRHLVGKPEYDKMSARLRMQRLAQPASTKVNFELFSLAVSALAGCESCIRSHEQVVTQGGLTPEHVLDAIRIAATINAAATALELRSV